MWLLWDARTLLSILLPLGETSLFYVSLEERIPVTSLGGRWHLAAAREHTLAHERRTQSSEAVVYTVQEDC